MPHKEGSPSLPDARGLGADGEEKKSPREGERLQETIQGIIGKKVKKADFEGGAVVLECDDGFTVRVPLPEEESDGLESLKGVPRLKDLKIEE